MSAEIETALSEWSKWPMAAKPELIREFDSGLNNTVALLRSGKEYLVLKCFTSGPQPGVTVQTWAAKLAIAPGIVFYSESAAYCLMEYCAEEQSDPSLNSDQLNSLAESLHILHGTEAPAITKICEAEATIKPWNLSAWLKHYDEGLQQNLSDKLLTTLADIEQEITASLQAFANDPTPHCLCHNDLVRENCFVNNERAQFIDWDYAQLNNPWFDIASVIHYFGLSENQTEQFLKAYASDSAFDISNQNMLKAAKCTVIWLDVLWHLNKFGEANWPEQQQKLLLLRASSGPLHPSSGA